MYIKYILKKYHIGRKKFQEVLKESNTPKNPVDRKKINAVNILSREEQDKIIQEYTINNKNSKEVANITGHNPNTVLQVLKRNNIAINCRHRIQKPKKVYPPKIYKVSPERVEIFKKTNKDRGRGTTNPSWKGYWVTPKGKFTFITEAQKAMNMCGLLIRTLCKDNLKPLKSHTIWHIKYFKELNISPGTLPKDIGFNFEPKDKN
jgi:DNA-directed RNA polymerase subunit H (RpoH/RPB5)